MPPILAAILALVGALWGAILTAGAHAQWKLTDPETDGLYQLRRRHAEDLGMKEWERIQQTRTARLISFLLASAFTLACLGLTFWHLGRALFLSF